MQAQSVIDAAQAARQGSPRELAQALRATRADTLATFAAYERALPALRVPQAPGLNPPLWELGHIGWFQSHWIGRNPQRERGCRADPDVPRRPPARTGADAWYDSSRVPHDRRWELPLPGAEATRADLALQLEETLGLLQSAPGNDEALYFFRLALLHEDMHHEAALYMARALGIAIDDQRWTPRPLPAPGAPLAIDAQRWRLGSAADRGFAFDNECPGHDVALAPFEIDAQAVRWAEFLPFVEAGGYEQPQWWTSAGARWRSAQPQAMPRYLRRGADGWEQWLGGTWRPLDPSQAANHLTFHEAQAWCRWAGRRLPTEAQWECAACTSGPHMRWGDVWEWTASAFAPFAGFEPHPYRDYSAPWFDGRPVLKGASHFTQPRMRHPKYRNFFTAERSDVPAGFRTCKP